MQISMQNRALYAFPVCTDQLHSNGRKAVVVLVPISKKNFQIAKPQKGRRKT